MAPDAGRFHRFAPGPPLSAFVDFLWISDGYAPPHARERLLPTGTMELVFTMDGEGPVADVLQGIGMSPRRFVDLFRSEVGLGPKVFCRVRRFHEALRRTERLTDVDWADVAQWCGYYDQAHFNHDFRAFSGLTPSSYL